MKSGSIILGVKVPRLAFRLIVAVSIVAMVFAMSRPVFAQATTVTLGSASTFAVLGASTVTNTGLTNVTGDLGVSPGTSITGFPPGTVTGGTIYAGDAVAAQAHTDLATAYNSLVAMPCGTNLTGKVLGVDVMTLSPGVYCFNSSAQLTGTLHLNGGADAVYVFQIGSTLTTASNSFVIVDNNVCGGNVYWQIGSSATLGTGTTFAGNIVALTSITITTSVTISGRALALNGAVTMDTNHVTACGAGIGGGISGKLKVTGGGQIPVPEGVASFGFNAQLKRDGTAKGHFNYVNHVTGLHVNGRVNSVVVIATNPDGSPKTVRFSGTCSGHLPACTFSVTVEDHGKHGTGDQFGITVTGGMSETASQRAISAGNIQFHLTHEAHLEHETKGSDS
jgi:hypothetical protein